MELAVADRIMLNALIAPMASDVLTLRLIRALQEELSFTDEETEALKFERSPDGKGVNWDEEAPQTREFTFSKVVHGLIVEQLQKANAAKSLTLQQLDLYEKFCPEEEGKEKE